MIVGQQLVQLLLHVVCYSNLSKDLGGKSPPLLDTRNVIEKRIA